MTDAFLPLQPHGALTEVFPDVFVVRGSFTMAPLTSITRNMTVVRRGNELTILNAVRLSDEGETQLAKLGVVKNLVRLGVGHGADDPYYVKRYAPRTFAPTRMRRLRGVTVDQTLSENDELPFGARAFVFQNGVVDELAVLLPDAGGVLITCDALQHWTTTEGCSLLGKIGARALGLMKPAAIGPIWLKGITNKEPVRVRPDFERLLTLDFKHLLPAHGSPLKDDAKALVRASVARTFR
jgi:hypothetical protein